VWRGENFVDVVKLARTIQMATACGDLPAS